MSEDTLFGGLQDLGGDTPWPPGTTGLVHHNGGTSHSLHAATTRRVVLHGCGQRAIQFVSGRRGKPRQPDYDQQAQGGAEGVWGCGHFVSYHYIICLIGDMLHDSYLVSDTVMYMYVANFHNYVAC